MVMGMHNAFRGNESREPRYERGKLYPVSVRLDGDTMRLLDDMLEQMHYDSYDSLLTDVIEQSHDAML